MGIIIILYVDVVIISKICLLGKEVKIHFDGWTDAYDYWCPTDAIELHPVGWCRKNNWELQQPRGTHYMYIVLASYLIHYIHIYLLHI